MIATASTLVCVCVCVFSTYNGVLAHEGFTIQMRMFYLRGLEPTTSENQSSFKASIFKISNGQPQSMGSVCLLSTCVCVFVCMIFLAVQCQLSALDQ